MNFMNSRRFDLVAFKTIEPKDFVLVIFVPRLRIQIKIDSEFVVSPEIGLETLSRNQTKIGLVSNKREEFRTFRRTHTSIFVWRMVK
jgi:hypothetical protein